MQAAPDGAAAAEPVPDDFDINAARPGAFVAHGENSSSTRVSFRSFDE